MIDYLIIGGGLAGTTLAYRLEKAGSKVILMDNPDKNISSSVAAGIVNPLTGKRTAQTWMAEEVFKELHFFYPRLESELARTFFQNMPTYKLFDSVYDQNEWLKKNQEKGFSDFMDPDICFIEKVKNPYGALKVIQSGRLDVKNYLNALHGLLSEREIYVADQVDIQNITIKEERIVYKDIEAKAVIFCDGAMANQNSYFKNLPFKNVHGELLEVEIDGFYEDRIINKGIFIVPEQTNRYLVGATYNWNLTEPILTVDGKNELEQKLSDLLTMDFKVIAHRAGIRPSTNDRRPFLGRHPLHKNMYIFGGLGSKGASLVPYLSNIFVNYLLHDGELPMDMDICRIKPQKQV